MAKQKLSEGDVILIPVAEGRYAVAKILWISLRTKHLILIGVSTKSTIDTVAMPKVAPHDDVRYFTGSQPVGTEWPIVGHDDTPIDPDVSRRRSAAGMVWVRDEMLHEATEDEIAKLPIDRISGTGILVKRLKDALGLPREDVPAKRSAPKAEIGPMDDKRFWSVLEDAWKAAPKEAKLRPTGGKAPSEDALEKVDDALEERVLPALRKALAALPADDLAGFDRTLEKKLYDLDRADVQEHTDGSDDGFLYARGFIVAMGRPYYDAVMAKPSAAIMDMECESISYLPRQLYEERHGKLPKSGISRETGSNKAGWK
jgi:hypothetical protein